MRQPGEPQDAFASCTHTHTHTSAHVSTGETKHRSTVGRGDGEFGELAPAAGYVGGGGGAVGGDCCPAPFGAGLTGTETHLDGPVFSIHLQTMDMLE